MSIEFTELKTDSYSLSMPVGWEVKRPQLNKTVLIGPEIGPFHAGIIVDELLGRAGEFLKIIEDSQRRQAGKSMFHTLDERDLSREGFAARYFRSEWYHEDANIMMESQQIFTCHGEDIFVITATLPNTPRYEDVNRVFTHIIESFRLV